MMFRFFLNIFIYILNIKEKNKKTNPNLSADSAH
jgi:hypothetical protein